jgi:hypothetical protein
MKKSVICCLVCLALVMAGAIAIACAPTFPKAVLTYARHPDFPRTEYLAGKLGVFRPSYARSYLVIAYRYLNGPVLSADERRQVRDYWKDRDSGEWDKTSTAWQAKWEEARMRVPGATPNQPHPATRGAYGFDAATNSFFLSCAEDAYRTAYQTLEARDAQFGFSSEAVRSWRDAQDAVFTNCDNKPAAPLPAAATLPALIRSDREYQIAAANFYAGHFTEAESQFRRIAATPASPWSGIAPYLVVRTLSRAAQKDPGVRPAAEAAARDLLKDASLAPLHGMTRVLLHRMILKDRDESYFHELAGDLAGGQAGRSFREELWDYTRLFDTYVGYDPWDHSQTDRKVADPAVFFRDDLSDWIYTFQLRDAEAGSHALARWRQNQTLAWLIAALRHASPGSPEAPELISAAARIDAASPGFEIASFYRLRLMVDSGQKAAARGELDRLLKSPLSRSSLNLFRGLRMRTAPDLAGFLNFASRLPVLLTTDWNQGEVPAANMWSESPMARAAGKALLDPASIKILNERTPMRLIRQAALSGAVPPYAERDFVLSAFTRALLLDDASNGLPLAAKLRAIGADPQDYLLEYKNAKDPPARRFAGIFYVLHHPESRPYLSSGLGRMGRPGRIDDYRDNWWCPFDIAVELDARTNWSEFGGGLPPRQDPDSPAWSEAFLTAADRRKAVEETARLASSESGPDYLIREVMRYAGAHPADPRIPEALHGALRAQRFGCVREQTAAAAEAAWKYLWRRYPKSVWARKSNYNFELENLPRAAHEP